MISFFKGKLEPEEISNRGRRADCNDKSGEWFGLIEDGFKYDGILLGI